MNKRNAVCRTLAMLTALTVVTGGISLPGKAEQTQTASAADTGSRIVVDLNANDGRKASYARWANNWSVPGGSSASTTIDGLTFKLSNGGSAGGDIRSVNCKILQLQSGIYPYLTMDGVTINDTTSGGVVKLEISGLSAGTHSLKTWHSCVDNATVGTMKITVNGQTTATGVKCPTRVTDEDDAGIAYSTFTVSAGQTVTVLVSPEGSGNAWLNGFEIDGGDPINGISNVTPADQDSHHDASKGLSWTAGKNAKSHDVYIGTSYNSVFNATTSSAEYKGNQSGTTYALDDTYSSIPTYYWRVDTIDSSGNVIKGSVYSFNLNRLAFPTAEGYGRYARGGRGGQVIHVTNLNDSGEGSLRWALCDAQWQTDDWKGVPRIIVFDVGGVIALKDTLCIPDNAGNVYVAGQTAPGDGITLINYDFGAMGSSDVVIRDIRTRVGDMNGSSHGGMGLGSCNQSIVDHCSISWATDEGFSSRSAQNITFQWNIIGESLHDSVHYLDSDRTQTECHAFAASIGGYTGSYHHNLLINCTGRNWSLAGAMEQDAKTYGGQVDIRNNVVYNWMDRTTDGGVRRLNFVNNYYKAGPVSNTNMHIVSIDGNELGTNDMQMMYVDGNVMLDASGNYLLKASDNAWDKGKAVSGGKGGATVSDVRSNSPFFESYVNTQSADDAYKSVIAAVGAGGKSVTGWDYIDSRYIKEVTNTTYTYKGSKQGLKGIIDSQNDVGGYPNSSNFAHSTDGATSAANDTDRDGMPNVWEEEHGLNPNDASDGSICTLSADDYTNVEMYLNELAGDPVAFNGTTIKAGTEIDTSFKYQIRNVGSGLFLEVADSTEANGTDVQQGTAGANGWTFESAGDGYYRLYSEIGDGKTYLLDLDSGNPANGTNIAIWTDTASDAQLFKFVSNGDGTYTIYTKVTEDTGCLGVVSGSAEAGASVIQWQNDGSANQKWTLEIKLDPIGGTLIQNLMVNDASLYNSWSIDTELAVGDVVFGDRDVTYTTIPEQLIGAEAIVTPCDAKNLTEDLATFTAGADMSVYIALDARVETPQAWLSDWTLTELTMTNSKDVVFNLYRKDVLEGEIITLGANGQSSGCVGYTVLAVRPAEEEEEGDDTKVLYGDTNCDSAVNVADIVLLARYVSQDTELQVDAVTAQGITNADVNLDAALTADDISGIGLYLSDMISLPIV